MNSLGLTARSYQHNPHSKLLQDYQILSQILTTDQISKINKCQHIRTKKDAIVQITNLQDVPSEDQQYIDSMKLEPGHLIRFQGVLDSNIAQIIDYQITSEKIVIVYEYFSLSLEEVFKSYPNGMPERIANRLLLQLVNALKHLHSRQIMHRNLKMDSIMLKIEKSAEAAFRNGQMDANSILEQAQLVLFGFKVCKEALLSNTWAGSKRTMAPEINNGQEYTQSVDIYSAGVIYYELVTGININIDIDDTDHNYRIRDRQSEQSRKLTERMLSFDPKGRPTAVELHRIFSEMVQKQLKIQFIDIRPTGLIATQVPQKQPIIPLFGLKGLTQHQPHEIIPTQLNFETNKQDKQNMQNQHENPGIIFPMESVDSFFVFSSQISEIANAEASEDPINTNSPGKVKLIQNIYNSAQQLIDQTQQKKIGSSNKPVTEESAQYQAIKKKLVQLDHLKLCHQQLIYANVATNENLQLLYRFIIAQAEYLADRLSNVSFKDQELQEDIKLEQLKIQELLGNQKSPKKCSELMIVGSKISRGEPEKPSPSLLDMLNRTLKNLTKDEISHLKGNIVVSQDRKFRAIIVLIVVLIDLGQITAPQVWIEMLELEIATSQNFDQIRFIIYSIILTQGIKSDAMQKWLNDQNSFGGL